MIFGFWIQESVFKNQIRVNQRDIGKLAGNIDFPITDLESAIRYASSDPELGKAISETHWGNEVEYWKVSGILDKKSRIWEIKYVSNFVVPKVVCHSYIGPQNQIRNVKCQYFSNK